MNTLQFLFTSITVGLSAVALSGLVGNGTTAPPKSLQEVVVTVYEPPSLDQRAGWCKSNKACKKMAKAVVYESRGEPLDGRYAVAWVIRNRVDDERWGSTIEDVIYQRKQFSFVEDKHLQTPPTEKDWTEALVVAYDVLNDEVVSPVWDSTHYHTTSVKPKWAKELELVAQIGNHNFYR